MREISSIDGVSTNDLGPVYLAALEGARRAQELDRLRRLYAALRRAPLPGRSRVTHLPEVCVGNPRRS